MTRHPSRLFIIPGAALFLLGACLCAISAKRSALPFDEESSRYWDESTGVGIDDSATIIHAVAGVPCAFFGGVLLLLGYSLRVGPQRV